MPKDRSKRENEKTAALDSAREKSGDHFLTTDQGLRINDDQNSLKAGARGPTLHNKNTNNQVHKTWKQVNELF